MLWYGVTKQRFGSLVELLDQPLCDIAFQVALWTFAQGRESFRDAYETMQRDHQQR
ncbi:hypothetical protein [Deinococcus ruber]|uniref:Uncharacterized protein n=1 Tax=Deinococcus ruber TaxID=1848197 RepID=A0A918CEA7_9DEIO|nr:hypothetical protein [Deinococcus ruber]GGR16809.1 hypothetical protein GCM10008957_31810 [Deinococcus ruber]